MKDNIHQALLAPFEDSDIEWRIQWVSEDKLTGTVVPYVTNRAIQNRLDDVVGFDRWRNEYTQWHSDGKHASQICGISIYIEERGEWVTKYDGAEDSDIEPIKGGLSDSMKRAAVQWGVGRYLYKMDKNYAKLEGNGKRIASSETSRLNQVHRDFVNKLFSDGPVPEPIPKPQEKPAASPEPPQLKKPEEVKPDIQKPKASAAGAVIVEKAVFTPSITGEGCTSLILKWGSKTTDAYFRGADSRLVAGAELTDCVFNREEKDGVVFIILEKFQIEEKAAA